MVVHPGGRLQRTRIVAQPRPRALPSRQLERAGREDDCQLQILKAQRRRGDLNHERAPSG